MWRILLLIFGFAGTAVPAQERVVLIDDFSAEHSALGTRWQGFTDRVMGGRSDIQAGYRDVDGGTVLVLRGQVRLDNNGGFIQARLPLDPRGNLVDATAFSGLRIEARALKPGPYYIHLRSADTARPWAYYRAPMALQADWTWVELPWSAFEPRSLNRPLNPSRLRSIAVVAYGEAFEADIEVARIEWRTD